MVVSVYQDILQPDLAVEDLYLMQVLNSVNQTYQNLPH